MSPDYFQFFDLPRTLAIDLTDLETRFYALSRKYHPDVHARRSAVEREQAEESTAVLNDGYRTLRDPMARAGYLLKLEGFDIGEQTTKDVPPELLEEVFELNMELEDDPGNEDVRRRFLAMRSEVDSEIGRTFSEWDSGRDRQSLVALRGLLNRRKYISNLISKTNVPD
jgi:molecular chaperone HscB